MSLGQLPLYLIIQPTGPFQGHQTNQPREYRIYIVNKAVTSKTTHTGSECTRFLLMSQFQSLTASAILSKSPRFSTQIDMRSILDSIRANTLTSCHGFISAPMYVEPAPSPHSKKNIVFSTTYSDFNTNGMCIFS